jgi:hypothetical protein
MSYHRLLKSLNFLYLDLQVRILPDYRIELILWPRQRTRKEHRSWIIDTIRDSELPECNAPDKFIDSSEVVKLYVEQDSLWTEECAKIADVKPGQVQQFTKHPIRARTMLQLLNASLVKYRMHAVDIRGVYAAPMEQHRFPWAQTCEDLFISWSEYEESHPFQEISQMNC